MLRLRAEAEKLTLFEKMAADADAADAAKLAAAPSVPKVGTGLRALKPFKYAAPGETHVHTVRKGRRAVVADVDGDTALVDFGNFALLVGAADLAADYDVTRFGAAL